MRWTLILSSALVLSCSETPRMQPSANADGDMGVPENPGPVVIPDLAAPALTMTAVSPKIASTVGRDKITITGTGFDSRTEFTIDGLRADIESVTATSAVIYAPADPGAWGRPISVVARRPSDGVRITNSNAAGSATAFAYYASSLIFTDTARVNPSNFTSARFPLLGDINNDGKVDILATFIGQASTSAVFNNGFGDFNGNVQSNHTPIGLGVSKGVLVDLDKDNNLDMVISDEGGSWEYNLGNGTGAMTSRGNNGYQVGCNAQSPVAADVTGDTYPDVAVACGNQALVRVWFNQFMTNNNVGAIFGTQNSGNQISLNTPSTPVHLAFADLNET